jgi:hypothetical protein
MWQLLAKLAGGGASGYAEGQARERSAKLNMEMDREGLRQQGEGNYVDSLFRREQERRASADSAWKRLQQAAHIAGGGTKSPGLSTYSRAIEGPSDNMKLVADNPTFIDELVKRAHGADPLNPYNSQHTDMQLRRLALPGSEDPGNVYGRMDNLSRPGKLEKLLGLLGGASTAAGNYQGGGDR